MLATAVSRMTKDSSATDTGSVGLHQRRLNGTDADCPSTILVTACVAEQIILLGIGDARSNFDLP